VKPGPAGQRPVAFDVMVIGAYVSGQGLVDLVSLALLSAPIRPESLGVRKQAGRSVQMLKLLGWFLIVLPWGRWQRLRLSLLSFSTLSTETAWLILAPSQEECLGSVRMAPRSSIALKAWPRSTMDP